MSQNSHDKEYEEWYEYTTSQGDTFDALALDLYDDETLSSEIIRENPKYADVLVFDAGDVLYLPVIEDAEKINTKPQWEKS